MKLDILFEHSGDGRAQLCSYIRLLLPLGHPANAGAWELSTVEDYAGGADVVIVERTWRPGPSTLPAARALVSRVRAEGARLIYSLDDNLLDWSPRSLAQVGPSAEQLSLMRLLAREADGIITSTPALGERLQRLNPCVCVVRNALDERLLGAGPAGAALPAAAPVVIGFMGTHSHDADLGLILEPLRAVLRDHSGRVELHFVGGVADARLRHAFDGLPVRVLDEGRPVDYPDFMRWFTDPAGSRPRWDIGLAPLEDTAFTRGKSDIKFLDYAAAGAAGVYSRVPAYSATVRDGETGLLVDNSVEAWQAALERLIEDSDLRRRLARGAHEYLWSQRVLAVCAGHWREAIENIVGRCARPGA